METFHHHLSLLYEEILEETGKPCLYNKLCGHIRLEDLYTTDNVYMSAWHCATGFRNRPDTMLFMRSPWINARSLSLSVLNGTFKPKYYPEQRITERGKLRTIRPPQFPCKVVQKVLCDNLLRPLLEPKMISTNFASIKGRGPSKCYEKVLYLLNRYGRKNSVIVMADFENFFGSINHEILHNMMVRYIEDERIVSLYMSFCDGGVGLSLGNEASQIPASYYPSSVDHYMKDKLGCKAYIRYMDDTLAIADGIKQAELYVGALKGESEKLKLTIPDDKVRFVPWGQDFIYCKERFIFNKEKQYYYRIPNPQLFRTQRQKTRKMIKKYENGEISLELLAQQERTVIGSMKRRPNCRMKVKEIKDILMDAKIDVWKC